MLDDVFQAGTDAVIEDMALRPQPPKQRVPSFSVWGAMKAAPRAVAAGAAEASASSIELFSGLSKVDVSPEMMAASETEEGRAKIQKQAQQTLATGFRDNEVARSLRNVAGDYLPDPVTAHGAEVAVAELFRMGGKAIAAGVTLGPVAGAIVAGAEEGFTTSEKLAEQGVDVATRSKVGGVTGLITGAGFALPVAGPTWKATAGLALAGGPVSFSAQQAATRAILEGADYTKQAQQYDPFDPVGLTLSTLIPLGFGALAMRGGARVAAEAGRAGETRADAATAPVDTVPAAGTISDQATVDAARVNLLREVSDAHRTTPPEDLAGATFHQTAISRAIDQLAEGSRVQIEDVLTEPAMTRAAGMMAERLRPLAAAVEEMRAELADLPPATERMPLAVERAESGQIEAATPPPVTPEAPGSAEPGAPEGGPSAAQAFKVEDAALDARAVRMEAERPDLQVQVDGADAPVRYADLMRQVREEAAKDMEDAPLIEAAAACFLRG